MDWAISPALAAAAGAAGSAADLSQLWMLVVAGGFVVGLLVGLTGVGAGSLMTPYLISVIGVNPFVAVGTDLLFACITKASAAVRHHRLNNVDYRILGWLAAGSVPAAAAVFLWLSFSGTDTAALGGLIRRMLAVVLIVSAVAVLAYPLVVKRFHAAAGLADLSETLPRPKNQA